MLTSLQNVIEKLFQSESSEQQRHPSQATRSASKKTTLPRRPAGQVLRTHPVQCSILFSELTLTYTLQRSSRRSIGFLIKAGALRVSAPLTASMGQIEQALQSKQKWILSKLSDVRLQLPQQNYQWEDGCQFLFLGSLITLRVIQSARASIHFDEVKQELQLHFGMTVQPEQWPELIRQRLKLWLQARAREIFLQRMPVYATALNVRYQSLHLSSAGTRWGSCTSSGKIRLNWKLIHFSVSIIDYVIAHELAHLLEMNHSPRFWAHVKSVFPEYQQAKLHLRQQAQQLPLL